MSEASRSERIRAYHQRTKHHLNRYAAGPANLDWDAQPDAFRQWLGTRHYALARNAASLTTPWNELGTPRPAVPFDVENLGNLLQLTSAITAWKQYGASRWALRAHPSSGNLHPTETWVIAYWVDGLADGLYHYQSREHRLEWRASSLTASETPGLWLGFSSIHWREAWKYGERALRYCQLWDYPAEFAEVYRVLKAADAIIEKSAVFSEIGKAGQAGSAEAQIYAKATALVAKDADLTLEEAVDKVMDMEPELYEKAEAERQEKAARRAR